MAEQSAIEWTDATYNPWEGCTKISPACDHCYAAERAARFGTVKWGGPRRRTSIQTRNKPHRWQREAEAFMAEHGRRRRVFCASLADVFDNQVPSKWREDLWQTIQDCPDLDWLLLTKRPQNIAKMLPSPHVWSAIKHSVWLGTTVENQEVANRNIPHLLQHDSAVRFLSCEPMLGPIDLSDIEYPWRNPNVRVAERSRGNVLKGTCASMGMGSLEGRAVVHTPALYPTIDWVITGGESGGVNTSRPADPDWFRSLRDQCEAAEVPFLFKQWGNWDEAEDYHRDKKALGRVLDGVTHDGFPSPQAAGGA